MKERWNYAKFVEAYNRIAKERGGQEFKENILPHKIEKSYNESSGRSLEEFVERYFQYRHQSEIVEKKEDRWYQKTDDLSLI